MPVLGDGDRLIKIRQLTSKWGIYQHGHLKRPDPKFGYAIDDQARALIVANEFGDKNLEKIYLDFILSAIEEKNPYHYFYDKNNEIVPDRKNRCSEDALGMIVWALMKAGRDGDIQFIVEMARKWVYPRSIAYTILGLLEDDKHMVENFLINNLISYYKEDGEWKWFDNSLTYGNALLPWVLWKRGVKRNDKKALMIAETATKFLINTCQDEGVPMPIGCKGWYKKGGVKNKYDQQPVDAAYMVCCLEQAYLATNCKYYYEWADKWWNWFFGNNTKGVKLIDENGACFDAVTDKEGGLNLNQGAESNICFLMAYLAVKRLGLCD